MRNEEIVKLRVFAILLVVLGHSIIIFDPNWGIYTTNQPNAFFYTMKQYINIIQMPIFIMIAGFLFCNSSKKYSFKKIVIEKFKRIMIPFFMITFVWLVPIRLFVEYQPYIEVGYIGAIQKVLLGIDSGHLWYLPTLYILFILTYLLDKIVKDKKIVMSLVILLLVVINLFSYLVPNKLFLTTICEYFIYFYIGLCVGKNNKQAKWDKTTIISLLLFVLLSSAIVFLVSNLYLKNILKMLTAILATYAFYGLGAKVKNNKIIETVDKNSFAIYLLHSPLLYILYKNFANINPYILVTTNVIVSVLVPSAIAYGLRKLKLNFIIGEKTQ